MKSSVKSTYNYNILNLTTFNNNSGVRNTGMSKKRKRTNNTLSGEVENSSDKSEHIESDFRNKVSNFSDKFRTNGEKTNATTASQNAALGKVGDKVKTISTIGEKSSASSESDPNTNNISKSGDKKVEKTSDAGVKDGLGTTLFSVGDSIGLGGDLSRFSVDLAKEVKVTNGIKLKEKLNGALQNGINDLGKRAKIRAIGTDFVNDHLALNCDKTAKPEKIKTDRLAISCDNVNPVKELDTLRNGDKERFFFTTSLFSLSHKIDKTKVSQNELSSVNQSNPKEYGEKVDEIIKNRSSAFDESQAEKTNTINSNVNSNVKNTMDDISNLEKYHKKHSSPPNKDKVNVKKIVSIDQILNRNLDMNRNKIVETEWKIDGTNGRIVEKSPKIIEANVKYVENAKSVESNTKIVERSTNNVKSNMGRSDLKRKIVDEYEFTDDEMGPNENSAKKSTPLCKEKFGLFNGGLRRIERTDTVSLRVVDIIRNGDKETIDDDLAAATNGKVDSRKVGTTNGIVEISKCEPDKSSEVVKVDLNKNKCKIDHMNGYVPIETSLVNGSNDIAKNAKQRTQSLQKFRKIFHSKNAVSNVTSSHGANSLSKIDEICNKLTKTSKENHSLNIGKAIKAPLPGNEEVNPKGVDGYNKESIGNRNIDLNKFDSHVSSRDDANAKRVIDIIEPNKTAVFENDQLLEIKAKEINGNKNVETNSPVLEKEPRGNPAVERLNQDIRKDELKRELKEFEEESDNRPTEHVDTKVANAETVPSDLKKENEGDASNVDTAIDVKKEVEESDGHIEETAEGNVVDATVVKTDVGSDEDSVLFSTTPPINPPSHRQDLPPPTGSTPQAPPPNGLPHHAESHHAGHHAPPGGHLGPPGHGNHHAGGASLAPPIHGPPPPPSKTGPAPEPPPGGSAVSGGGYHTQGGVPVPGNKHPPPAAHPHYPPPQMMNGPGPPPLGAPSTLPPSSQPSHPPRLPPTSSLPPPTAHPLGLTHPHLANGYYPPGAPYPPSYYPYPGSGSGGSGVLPPATPQGYGGSPSQPVGPPPAGQQPHGYVPPPPALYAPYSSTPYLSSSHSSSRLTSRSPQTPASSHLKSSAPPPPPQPPPTSLPSSHPPNPTSHAPIHASLPHASTAQHPSSGLPHPSNVSHASTLPHGSSGLPHPSTGLSHPPSGLPHPSSGIPHTSTLPHGSSGLPHASSGLTHSSTATSQAASHGRMLHSPHDMSPSRSGDNSYSSSVSSLSRSSSGLPPAIRHTPPPVSSQSVSAPPSGGVGVPLSSSLAFSKPPSVSSTPPVWVSTSSGVSSSSPLSSVMRSSPAPSTLSRTPTYLPPMDTPTPVSQPYQAPPYLPPGSQAPPTSYGSQAPPTSYAGSQPPTSYGSQVPPTSYPPSQTTPSYIPPSATQTPPTSYLPAVSSQPPYPSVTQTTPSYLGPQATPTSVAPSVQPPPGAPPPPTQPPTNPNPFSAESLFQTNHTDLLRRELDSRFLASSQDVHHHRGAPYSLRTEMHHHQHQHTHVHQHAPLMPPPPGAAALYPPTHLFKDIPKLGAGVDSPFYRHSLALSTYPPGFGLHPGLTPTPTATPFAPPNQYTSFTPKQLTEPPKPKPMKTGKWNAMHVRIAWEIYNHQQKAMAVESKGLKPSLPSASDLLRPPSHLLPSAAPRPPHPYDSPGGPAPPLPPHSAASVLASPFSSLNMFGRYGPSVPTFPPLSSFPSSPLTDPWARLQASRPLAGHPGGYTTPAPPAPTPSAPWSLKPDPVELEREKEREREREREKERIRERERVRREEKQRRLMQQQQAQAAQQKSAAAAAAAVAASQSLHRDRSPLRSDPTASLSGVPGSMLSSKGDDDVMMQMSRGLLSPYLSRVPPVASATGRLGSGVGGVGAHLHPSSRGPYPPPPSPWDPYRYDPLRYNPLMAVAFQREEEERAKLFGAPFAPPAAHHMRSGPPGKVPSPASRLMSGPSPADIKKEETTPAGSGR
ncbi:hypothetical protein M8J75_014704 [Diaphorina citri]|nr:hypothetical protein M8J75_014704 [Diaphorina citri]